MKICITSSVNFSHAETFIKDQVTFFSAKDETHVIHSGRLPERDESGKLLASAASWALHQVIKGTTGLRNNYFGNQAVKEFLRKKGIDVVLANYGLTGAHLVSICYELNIPLIVIFHGHDITDREILHDYEQQYRALFKKAYALVVVSQDLRNQLLKLGADYHKIHVIPCGVNINLFSLGQVASDNKTFLAVGRFTEKKGPLLTIQAFHKVWLKYPDAQLIMGGPHAGLYQRCSDLIQDLGMTGSVRFPGALSHVQVQHLMRQSMVFVQHSITARNGDTEGTPVSILEASASGLPIVSTRHGGIKQAVIEGRTGLLVNENDIEAMADAMIELLENNNQRHSFGQAGREHIERNYDQQLQLGKIRELALISVK